MQDKTIQPTTEYDRTDRLEEAVKKWDVTGLLRDFNHFQKGQIAAWLENIRLATSHITSTNESAAEQIKRCIIPLMRRVAANCKAKDFVSFQTMFGPTGLLQVWNGEEFYERTFTAKTRQMKGVWRDPRDLKNSMLNLDVEAEAVSVLATELAVEIDREVLHDLCNNVPITEHDCGNYEYVKNLWESISAQIETAGKNIADRTVVKGQLWAVTSPEVYSTLESSKSSHTLEEQYPLQIHYRNTYGDVKVYVDPLFPKDTILVGLKADDERISGYYYAPYVTYFVAGPLEHSSDSRIMSRYGKCMVENGEKFYQKINLKNLVV